MALRIKSPLLKLVKPGPMPLRTANTRDSGCFTPHKFHYSKAPVISYPEDEMRQAFFRSHPFELNRPISVTESLEIEKDWSTIDGLDSTGRPAPLSGESVIKHALWLISEGFSRNDAYRKSLESFYKKAEQLERQALDRKQKEIDRYMEKKREATEQKILEGKDTKKPLGRGGEEDSERDFMQRPHSYRFFCQEEQAIRETEELLSRINKEKHAMREASKKEREFTQRQETPKK